MTVSITTLKARLSEVLRAVKAGEEVVVTERGRPSDLRALLAEDPRGAFWWGTPTECESAFARRHREGHLDHAAVEVARCQLEPLATHWPEVLATDEVRRQAGLLLRRHPLGAADALQLPAALTLFGRAEGELVTLDARLADAARGEGLRALPR